MSSEMGHISTVLRTLQCPTRQKVMVLLMNKDHRSIPEIVKLTGMSQPLTFNAIRQLEASGLISRIPNPGETKWDVYQVRRVNHGYIAAIYDNARLIAEAEKAHGRHKGRRSSKHAK